MPEPLKSSVQPPVIEPLQCFWRSRRGPLDPAFAGRYCTQGIHKATGYYPGHSSALISVPVLDTYSPNLYRTVLALRKDSIVNGVKTIYCYVVQTMPTEHCMPLSSVSNNLGFKAHTVLYPDQKKGVRQEQAIKLWVRGIDQFRPKRHIVWTYAHDGLISPATRIGSDEFHSSESSGVYQALEKKVFIAKKSFCLSFEAEYVDPSDRTKVRLITESIVLSQDDVDMFFANMLKQERAQPDSTTTGHLLCDLAAVFSGTSLEYDRVDEYGNPQGWRASYDRYVRGATVVAAAPQSVQLVQPQSKPELNVSLTYMRQPVAVKKTSALFVVIFSVTAMITAFAILTLTGVIPLLFGSTILMGVILAGAALSMIGAGIKLAYDHMKTSTTPVVLTSSPAVQTHALRRAEAPSIPQPPPMHPPTTSRINQGRDRERAESLAARAFTEGSAPAG